MKTNSTPCVSLASAALLIGMVSCLVPTMPLGSRLNYQLFGSAVLISRISRFSFRFALNASSMCLEPLRKMIVAPRASVFASGKAKQAIRGWLMEPDAVQRQNKPLECRLILRRCSYIVQRLLLRKSCRTPDQVLVRYARLGIGKK